MQFYTAYLNKLKNSLKISRFYISLSKCIPK